MLDILSMPQYTSAFTSKGLTTIDSLIPAVEDPHCPAAFWLKLVPKAQDRNIILGYLSIRRKQDPMEAAKSEQRMAAFRTVKGALMELQNLQLKKAELERGSTVLNRKESTRQEIENILDKIDDTKQKLESAQRSINGLGDDAKKGRTRPHSASLAHRMRSKLGEASTEEPPRSPRVDNESPVRHAAPRDEGSIRPSSARPVPAKPSLGSQRRNVESRGSRPSSSSTCRSSTEHDRDDVFAGTCFSSVRFGSTTEPTTTPPSLRAKQSDIGPGWNRNTPVPRMRQWASVRNGQRFGQTRGGGTEQFGDVDASCNNATCSSSTAPPPTVPVAGTPRPNSGSSLGLRQTTQPGFAADFAVRGLKATSVALGVNLENDHYAQMCCGAVQKQDRF